MVMFINMLYIYKYTVVIITSSNVLYILSVFFQFVILVLQLASVFFANLFINYNQVFYMCFDLLVNTCTS